MSFLSVRGLARRAVYVPWVPIPEGRMAGAARPRRDVRHRHPGPHPDAPTVLLLHAVGCTGMLTWFPASARCRERYRVVTLDQRWHGRGIKSEEFSLLRLRRRRRRGDRRARPRATRSSPATRWARSSPSGSGASTPTGSPGWCSAPPPTASGDRRPSGSSTRAWSSRWSAPAASPGRVRRCARRARPAEALDLTPADIHDWALGSSAAPARGPSARPSPRSAATTRARGCRRIDVPTAVVVTNARPGDPARRASSPWPAGSPARRSTTSPPATPCCVLESELFVPGLPRGGRHRQRPPPRLRRGGREVG